MDLTIEEVKEWAGAVDDTALTFTQKERINEAYNFFYGKNIRDCGCVHRYTDASLEIYKTYKIKGNDMMYQLKAGVVLTLRQTGEMYSNANITTVGAEKILKNNKEDIRFFSVYPADWEERISEKKTVKSSVTKKINVPKNSK